MPHLHFSRSELDRRLVAVRASLAREGLDGLVLFRQDSMYWLTGYDTSGYTICAVTDEFLVDGSREGGIASGPYRSRV